MASSSSHHLLPEVAERYWVESSRPLASLVFIAPLLLVYELGVLFLGVQNGADAFMRRLLDALGFGQHLLLPLLTVCVLLVWHYLSRQPWQLSGGVISAMSVECLLLGVLLRVVLFVQDSLFQLFDDSILLGIGPSVKQAIGFLGAGIYEELLFRLILLGVIGWGLRRAGTKPLPSTILAVAISSLLFAAAHHIGPGGEPFDGFRFLFRVIAGVFFSILIIFRGFGIVAGSHAAYDVIAWLSG